MNMKASLVFNFEKFIYFPKKHSILSSRWFYMSKLTQGVPRTDILRKNYFADNCEKFSENSVDMTVFWLGGFFHPYTFFHQRNFIETCHLLPNVSIDSPTSPNRNHQLELIAFLANVQPTHTNAIYISHTYLYTL